MGLIDRLFYRGDQRVTVVTQVPQVADILGMDVEKVYETQPALRAVVDFLSRNIAQLPLKCYLREADDDRVRDTESTVALLLAQPNATMTTYEVIDRLVHDFKLYGWALWYVVPSVNTVSGWEIDPIPVAWIEKTPTIDGFSPVRYDIYNPATKRRTSLPAQDCIRFAAYNPSHPSLALSPVDALKGTLAEQVSAMTFRNQQWKNGGRFNSYLKRPADAPSWDPTVRDRFITAWKEKYTGNNGSQAGGMPLLEDGMTIETTQFNSQNAQWAEAMKLSREDVAGVYHVNPALVWSNDGQTYASAKENARSLYVDTLGPDLRFITDRLNAFLLPKVGAPANSYVEFDLNAKLNGSFEEQASSLQTAVGGPYMTRAEARARMNLPRLSDQGLEELIVPLNVITGGQASPTDTDTSNLPKAGEAVRPLVSPDTPEDDKTPVKDAETPHKAADDPQEPRTETVELHSGPDDATVEHLTELLSNFFARQQKSVLNALARGDEEWFKSERWNKELADDLGAAMKEHSVAEMREVLSRIGIDADNLPTGADIEAIADAYLKEWAAGISQRMNDDTRSQLDATQGDDQPFDDDDAEGNTPEGVFAKAIAQRAPSTATTVATAMSSWDHVTALKYSGAGDYATKTWMTTSKSPRASHAAMAGETIPMKSKEWDGSQKPGKGWNSRFSNGQRFPGDYRAGKPEEVAGCKCRIDITVTRTIGE